MFSPYSTVNGNCKIGNGNFLGTGAVINPSIEIGKNNKVSSNSVLKKCKKRLPNTWQPC